MKSFKLTEKEMNDLADKYPTPFLVASLDKISENYAFLQKNLPRAKVFFAMKANPTGAILQRMASLGSNFDVASPGEMRLLHSIGVEGDRMIYANPVKTLEGLRLAAEYVVNKFTFDDESEIGKMAATVPGAQVLVRIRVKNAKAVVDLNTKFGTPPEKALQLLQQAEKAGLRATGSWFRVGSQSLTAEAYGEALLVCRRLFDEAAAAGMQLSVLDIGGGLPVPSLEDPTPDIRGMLRGINRQLDRLFPQTEIWSEPGRYVCGTAVNLVTSVIGTKERGGEAWYVLDDGLYGTFNGIVFDHWTYELEFFQRGEQRLSTFVGPSCDSIDVVRRDLMAHRLSIGDRVLVPNCGSYTNAAATSFNGFVPAQMVVWEEEQLPRVESAVS